MNGRKFPNWNPRTASALSVAYNEALQRARDLGFENDRGGVPLSDAIADYIVECAKRGIFDPKALAEGAIKHLQRD
jgi:hypothetical protein